MRGEAKQRRSRLGSRLRITAAVAALTSVALLIGTQGPEAQSKIAGTPVASAAVSMAPVREAYGRLPLTFEANHGQATGSVDFLARGAGYTVALSPHEAALALKRSADAPAATLRMSLVGANPNARGAGATPQEGKVNYFTGDDPEQWQTNIPTFSRVHYREVYPGIDLVYYGNQRHLEYDFVVAPGRNPRTVALEFPGVESVEIEAETGDLLLQVAGETIRQRAPLTYQETEGGRRKVESRYAMLGSGRVGFDVGSYDTSAPLVIDPVLIYSTHLGGFYHDVGLGIAVDAEGNSYVTGHTDSLNFPTKDAIRSSKSGGGSDAFVTKINAAGTAIVYSTYLGGSATDGGTGIAVDSDGNAYVTGYAASTDFPRVNPIQSSRSGSYDIFVTKINAAGNAFVYSTYLGGSDSDQGTSIGVDAEGAVYVSGLTASTNFPTANAIQATYGGGINDGVALKINAAGSALVYSTYLGGSGDDRGNDIAVDSAGRAYVIGSTDSSNFPLANAIQASLAGGSNDAFVAKLNAAGTAFVYSTYFGGSGRDEGNGVAADSAGNTYLTGRTDSPNLPILNAIQSTYQGGDSDAFVTKLNAAGTALVYSTYLGGSEFDAGTAIAVNFARSAYVCGVAGSDNFPTVDAFQSTRGGFGDAFVTKINEPGSALVYSSFLGGSYGDGGEDIALGSEGEAYLVGSTGSPDFPVINAIQPEHAGQPNDPFPTFDAFVAKMAEPPPARLLNISTRARIGTGENALIGGFIITGNEPKKVIIRAIGPSLSQQGVAGALQNPTLDLVSGGKSIAFNDNWQQSQPKAIEDSGVAPPHERESAIVRTLQPGNYTAVVRGAGETSGVGLVEVYDLAQGAQAKLVNISSRGLVQTGENVMIGGFITGGGGPTRVMVRAIGPSLGAAGVQGALQDPTLDLVNANGVVVRSNDNWKDTQRQAIEASGIKPSDERESALIEVLSAGSYTAIIRGSGNTTGVGLVEVYQLE